jgi:hypothetical protein
MTRPQKYDERQLTIRGQAFRHGFALLAGLVLLDGWLGEENIVWASPFWSAILIVMIPAMVSTVELILRGAYGGAREDNATGFLKLWGALSVVVLICVVFDIVDGRPLRDDTGLAQTGGLLIVAGLVLATTATLFGRWRYERRLGEDD